jgi:hypothetical protein
VKPCITMMSATQSTVTIRPATERELPRCAAFLAQSMYPPDVPRAQQNELQRLEFQDLKLRYGELVGKRKYPSVFFVAVEDEEIIG